MKMFPACLRYSARNCGLYNIIWPCKRGNPVDTTRRKKQQKIPLFRAKNEGSHD